MRTWLAYFVIAAILGLMFSFGGHGDDFDDETPSKQTKPKKSPQKPKQTAPADDEGGGAMVYPIGDKAMVVFFDPVRNGTYDSGGGVTV